MPKHFARNDTLDCLYQTFAFFTESFFTKTDESPDSVFFSPLDNLEDAATT